MYIYISQCNLKWEGGVKRKKYLHFANNNGITITRGEVIGKQRKRDVSDHDTAFWIIR